MTDVFVWGFMAVVAVAWTALLIHFWVNYTVVRRVSRQRGLDRIARTYDDADLVDEKDFQH